MYCPSCGTTVTPGLNYCKRCGAKLSTSQGEGLTVPSGPAPDSLVWGIVAVLAIGIGTTIGLMAVMKQVLNFRTGLIIAVSLLILLLTLAIEITFIWLLVNQMRGTKEPDNMRQLKEQMMRGLSDLQTSGLPAAEPSISEHTTHNLEPIYSEPKSKL